MWFICKIIVAYALPCRPDTIIVFSFLKAIVGNSASAELVSEPSSLRGLAADCPF